MSWDSLFGGFSSMLGDAGSEAASYVPSYDFNPVEAVPSFFDLFNAQQAMEFPVPQQDLFFDDYRVGSDLSPGAVLRDIPQQQGGDYWSKLGANMEAYLTNPENLLKLGVGGIGGLMAYSDAAKRNKMNAKLRKAQEAEIARRRAEAEKYAGSVTFSNARNKVAAPVEQGGEATYFTENRLPMAFREESPYVKAATGGYYEGGTKGQDDKIPAMLSDGEFVIDAETVSMLGDGNNAAGASALEQMRQNVRKQKRKAPVSKIPPKAKAPETYMKGKK